MKRTQMRMKRLLLLLLAYAVGGAIINVAVAWGHLIPRSLHPEAREERYVILSHLGMWPGFAINTTFYAAILWLLIAAPGFVRRRFVIRGRVRRGQCPACAYPVGASDVCTECGNAVRVRSP